MSARMPSTESAMAETPGALRAPPGTEEAPEPAVPAPFLTLLLATGAVTLLLLRPYAVVLFLAATLAVTLHPLFKRIERAFGGRPSLAAAAAALGLLAVGVAPLLSLAAYSASAINEAVGWAKEHLHEGHIRELQEGQLPGPLRQSVGSALSRVNLNPEDLEKYAGRAIEFIQRFSPQLALASLGAISSLLFVLIAFYFFLKDGPTLARHLHALSPLKRGHTARLFGDFRSVATASLLGMVFTGIGQSFVLSAGYWLASLPNVFVLSLLTGIAAFVPLAGSMLAWLPIALVSGVLISAKTGVCLAIYSLVATNVVDAGLKPMVLKGQMQMHGGVMFLGIIGGISLFGPVGFIAGPMVIAFFMSFLQMYERDYKQKFH